jgi:peptidoglycan/LPS O-acetylase OafA/YrhL
LGELRPKAERLAEFDDLRGLTIALIVLSHSIYLPQQGFPQLLENLLRGGTGLFVFISGFFFHRVFYPRFVYWPFIAKKFQRVFVPFVVISLVGLSLRALGWWQDGSEPAQILLNCWYTLRNGFVLYPHWYIPFIMLTFLCSPLHLAYIRLPAAGQIGILVALCLVSLFLHRPDGNINQLQSLVYFTPYYLLGIVYSQHLPWLRLHSRAVFGLSLLLVATALLLQTYIYPHAGNYHKLAFDFAGVDLQFIQVLGLCLLLPELCRQLRWAPLQRQLSWLAQLSFPIFFVHPLLTMGLELLLERANFDWSAVALGASLLGTLVIFALQLYGSAALVVRLRRYLGRRSQWLIG